MSVRRSGSPPEDTVRPETGEARGPAALDQTLAPAPLRDLLAAEGAGICLCSSDGDLIETVQQAAGDQYPITEVDDWGALIDTVRAGHCGIALLDNELIGASLERRLEELERAVPKLVVLVASPRKEAEALMPLLSERKIHRLLMKPAAAGITRLLLESALSRYLELRELAPEPAVARAASPERGRELWGVAAVVVVLLAGAAAGFWWFRSSAPVPQTVVSPGTTPAAAATERARASADQALIAGLLERAAAAEADDRLDTPPGDNAIDHYLSVLRIDPSNETANQRIEVVLATLYSRVEQALLNEAPDEAAAILDRVRRVRPDSPRLAFLDHQREELAARLAAAAEPAPPEPAPAESAAAEPEPVATPKPPSELDSLLGLVRARIARGSLLAPDGDNAEVYLQRAAAIAPDDAQVVALRRELANAIAASARVVLDLGDLDQAVTLAAEARRISGDSTAFAALDTEITAARDAARVKAQSDVLARGVARLESGQLLEPTNDNAVDLLLGLEADGATLPDLPAALAELGSKLAEQGRAAIAASRWDDAERWVGALRRADPAAADTLEGELTVARRQAEFLATAIPAGQLQRVEGQAPEYPDSAWRNNVEGWVDLEFVVDRDGRPQGLEVVGANPEGRFEDAARTAVATYRYAPYELDGVRYERRVRLRIRFALQ